MRADRWAKLSEEDKQKVLEYNKKYSKANREKVRYWNKKWYNKVKGIVQSEESLLEYSKRWHRQDYTRCPHKYMLKYAKARAVRKDLPIDIDLQWCIDNTPEVCPILGVKLVWLSGDYAPSIDRKVPELGYTKDNCWVISSKANKMKWDATHEELLAFCVGILRLEKEGKLR